MKKKTTSYILGMITGVAIMIAIWALTSTPLKADYIPVQEVRIVNNQWDPVYVKIVE